MTGGAGVAVPRIPAGSCAHCGTPCIETLGIEIWPEAEAELARKVLWRCPTCHARVGSHPDGSPLGTAADKSLREARIYVHGVLDPLWKTAHLHPAYASSVKDRKGMAIISKTARRRVYRWLADRMAMAFDDTHVAMMDITECRAAYRLLRRLTYDEVREWARLHPEPEPEGKRRPHRSPSRARKAAQD